MRSLPVTIALAGLLALSGAPAGTAQEAVLTVTIIYDNYPADPACGTDWGFSCLIEGAGKTVLFDAGTREDLFLKNAAALGLDLARVDLAVLSHFHGDHTGGLDAALGARPGLTIHVPADGGEGAAELAERWRKAGAGIVRADGPVELAKGVFLTGTMGTAIREQAMALDTGRGLVVITGCAHPGIAAMVEKAREATGRPVRAVLGGFHLGAAGEPEVGRIIARFKEMGVSRVGASHCTGDRAVAQFRAAYGDGFIELGAGRVVKFEK